MACIWLDPWTLAQSQLPPLLASKGQAVPALDSRLAPCRPLHSCPRTEGTRLHPPCRCKSRAVTVPSRSARLREGHGLREGLDDGTRDAPCPVRRVTRFHRGPVNDITELLPEGRSRPRLDAERPVAAMWAAWALLPTAPPHAVVFWQKVAFWVVLSGHSGASSGDFPPSSDTCLCRRLFRPLGRKVRSPASCVAAVWGASYHASKLLPFLLFPQDYFYPRYLGKLSPCLCGHHEGIEGDPRPASAPGAHLPGTCLCLSRPRVRVSPCAAPLLANGFSARTPGLTSCLGLGLT